MPNKLLTLKLKGALENSAFQSYQAVDYTWEGKDSFFYFPPQIIPFLKKNLSFWEGFSGICRKAKKLKTP